MSFVRLAVAAPVIGLALTGCMFNVDSDDDGLSNREEAQLGLDPDSPDSDGDGLDDLFEVEEGLDPLSDDSDGDGYLDPWEVDEGTDPLDDDSRIYHGYWPYNPDKGALDDPGFNGPLKKGDFVWNFVAKDQFGDDVSLYDFLGQGKDVILDASAEWCVPCMVTAEWLSSGGEVDGYNYEPSYKTLREAIDDGDVYWVTVLTQNQAGNPSAKKDAEEWDGSYPHENVPVLADPDSTMLDGVVGTTGFFPSGMLLNENGKVLFIGQMSTALEKAQDRL